MTKGNYYKIVRVAENASIDEIKKAYRRLAIQWHPDKNPGDRAAHRGFQNISEAYAVLSDPKKREGCDHRLKSPRVQQNSSPPRRPSSTSRYKQKTSKTPNGQRGLRPTRPLQGTGLHHGLKMAREFHTVAQDAKAQGKLSRNVKLRLLWNPESKNPHN